MSSAYALVRLMVECIGKVTVTTREDASEGGKEEKKNSGTNTTRASMKIGKKWACRDKNCIGET